MKKIFKLLLAIIVMLPFFACNREESELGLSLQDADTFTDSEKYTDATVSMSTVYADSLLTKNLSTTLIGEYTDNTNNFGKVTASLYSQIALSGNNGVDLSSRKLDSLVLCMDISGVAPLDISTKSINLEVFQLTEDLSKEKTYYAFSKASFNDGTPLASQNVAFNPADSIPSGNKKLPPRVRIKLSDAFRDDLGKKWASSNELISAIKGIHVRVKPNSGENKVAYFNLNSANSGLIMYYKNEDNEAKTYRFMFDTTYARFGNFTHDYSGTPLAVFKTNPKASISGDSKLYFETLGGTRLKLNFPDIIKWGRDSNYAIDRAILTLTIDKSAMPSNNVAPAGVYCYMINKDGKYSLIIDYSFTGSGTVQYLADKGEYKIYLTRHLQNMLNGNFEDWGFILVPYQEQTTANRVIIKGLSDPQNPPHLEIIYTKKHKQ